MTPPFDQKDHPYWFCQPFKPGRKMGSGLIMPPQKKKRIKAESCKSPRADREPNYYLLDLALRGLPLPESS